MEDFELYCGDCLEVIKNIPDKSIDLVLCDLPFGVTRNWWDKKKYHLISYGKNIIGFVKIRHQLC